MDPSRRYDDNEVKALLARAVELSREDAGRTAPKTGMSLAELERAAAEAGLSLEAVRRAAAELEAGGLVSRRGIAQRLFGSFSERAERRLGSAVDAGTLARLALDFPDMAGVPGGATTAGGDLVFRSDGGYESMQGQRVRFELKSVEGGTQLVAERKFGNAAAGVYGGMVGGLGLGVGFGVGGGVGLGALHSGGAFALIALGSLVVSFLVGRGVMALLQADARRRNERLLEDVTTRVGSGPSQSST